MSDSDTPSFDGECVPEESINAALALLEPGQKLFLHPGVYMQTVLLDRDVTLVREGRGGNSFNTGVARSTLFFKGQWRLQAERVARPGRHAGEKGGGDGRCEGGGRGTFPILMLWLLNVKNCPR